MQLRPSVQVYLFDLNGARIGGAVLGDAAGKTIWVPEADIR
ncbi:hypothetical protein [Yoonia sp.]